MLVHKSGRGNGVCHMWREKVRGGERERKRELSYWGDREGEVGGGEEEEVERNKGEIRKKENFFLIVFKFDWSCK